MLIFGVLPLMSGPFRRADLRWYTNSGRCTNGWLYGFAKHHSATESRAGTSRFARRDTSILTPNQSVFADIHLDG